MDLFETEIVQAFAFLPSMSTLISSSGSSSALARLSLATFSMALRSPEATFEAMEAAETAKEAQGEKAEWFFDTLLLIWLLLSLAESSASDEVDTSFSTGKIPKLNAFKLVLKSLKCYLSRWQIFEFQMKYSAAFLWCFAGKGRPKGFQDILSIMTKMATCLACYRDWQLRQSRLHWPSLDCLAALALILWVL